MQVGQIAPSFTASAAFPHESANNPVRVVSLADYKDQWLLLLWYPLDFTFVCPTELLAFSERLAEFEECGCKVLGASCDSVHSHRAWMRTPREQGGIEGVAFPILADKTGKIARDWDVLIEEEGHSLRALFLIDPEGVVMHAAIHAASVGRSVDETLRTLHALQSGGLCASDWKPGDANL